MSTNNCAENSRLVYSAYLDELEAISDYIYFSIISQDNFSSVSDIFEKIAIEEMRHFRALGQLLISFGANPSILTNIRTKNVKYSPYASSCAKNMSVMQAIENSITGEKKTIRNYESILRSISDPKSNEVISKILQDEENHIHMLSGIK